MILMYHKVSSTSPTSRWVTADAFGRQMADLAAYDVVPLSEYDAANPRHAAITFDGVYENVYRFAFPILKKWGYPFELFVIGDRIGEDNAFDTVEPPARFCTLEQLAEMASQGGRLQWHTRTHGSLLGLSKAELLNELTPSEALAARFPSPHFDWFAYPHGEHDDRLVATVRGRFKGALSYTEGSASDPHQRNRVMVLPDTQLRTNRVSIIVANYNCGRFLSQAIESVLSQTFPPDEVLVIDDASTDNSVEVLTRYRDKLRIVVNESNLGIVASYRKAVSLTSGDYVCFLGADNVMRVDYVEQCKVALDSDPKAAIAYTDMSIFGPRSEALAKKVGAQKIATSALDGSAVFHWRFPNPGAEALAQLKQRNFMHGSSLFRRSAYDAVGGYRETSGPEEHDLFTRMVEAGWQPTHVPHPLIFYRQHSPQQANALLGLQHGNSFLRKQRTDLIHELKAANARGDELTRELEAAIGRANALHHALELANARGNGLTRELEVSIARADALHRELEAVNLRVDGLRRDLEASLVRGDALHSELEASRRHVEKSNALSNNLLSQVTLLRVERDWLAQPFFARWSSRIGRRLLILRRKFRIGASSLYRWLPARIQNALDGLQHRYRTGSLSHSLQNQGALRRLLDERFIWATGAECVLPLGEPQPKQWPVIDISLVTYNSTRWLPDFFASLLAQDYPLDRIQLRVVDNGSTDATVADIEAFRSAEGARFALTEILHRPNIGYGLGHNASIERGSAEFVLVANVDLTIERQTITTLMSAALADDGRTAAWEARQKPFEHPKHYDPVTGETNWTSHAFVLMRRSAYRQVGGYEPRLFMYGEDVELSYRFRRAGFRLRYVPSAVVWHYTYEDASTIKPLQYRGSTLANILLRFRYGTMIDALIGLMMLYRSIRRPEIYPGSRRDLFAVAKELARKAPYFLARRGTKAVSFPFRGWDYELVREGAFVVGTVMPETAPLVSIVIRTYRGRGSLLRQAIASALQQTYPAIEVVVVEDGGEEMRPLVESMELPPGRRIVYRSLAKVGRSAAGNEGLRIANGDYLNFLDDDDLLYLDHVETLMAAIKANAGADAAYSLAWQIATAFGERYKDARELEYETLDIFRQPFSFDVLHHHNFIPIQTCLFSCKLFLERGGFEENLDALEDWNLWLRYAYGSHFVFVPKTTSLFRIPADMETRRKRGHVLHNAYESARQQAMERIAARETAAGSAASVTPPLSHRPAN